MSDKFKSIVLNNSADAVDSIRYEKQVDGTFAEVVKSVTSGAIIQEVPDTTPANMSDVYTFNIASGDFVNVQRSSNGQQFTEVSLDPLGNDTETSIEYKKSFRLPAFLDVAMSISQRTKGDYPVIEITDKDSTITDLPTEYSLVTSYVNPSGITVTTGQAGTTLTVILDSAFDGYLGSWVDIYGLVDNRFNYTNLGVSSISDDKRVLTFIIADEAIIPSLTNNPSTTGGKLKRQAKLASAGNAIAMRFTGISHNTAAFMAKFGGGGIKEVGTINQSRLAACSSTVPTYVLTGVGQGELKTTSRYRFDVSANSADIEDYTIDNPFTFRANRIKYTEVKPSMNADYYLRFRGVSPKSISRPIATVYSCYKNNSTTATVVTDTPHGLVTGNYVEIKGNKDQTNFPDMTTPASVTVVNATSFTLTIGATTPANTYGYGGAVILVNGGVELGVSVISTNVFSTIERNSAGTVKIVATANWTTSTTANIQNMEYVNLYGVKSSTGVDLGFDGVYRVYNYTSGGSTTLLLEPVKNLYGQLAVNGAGQTLTPNSTTVVSATSCSGILMTRTTVRSHDIVMGTYSEQITKIDGQGTQRLDKAIPVSSAGTFTVSTNESGVMNPSTYTLTTAATTNGASIKTTAGNVYAISVSNLSAATVYLKLYNKASAPTVGTDVPLITIPIAANSAQIIETGRVGIRFATGIASAVTGAITNDTTPTIAGNSVVISYI